MEGTNIQRENTFYSINHVHVAVSTEVKNEIHRMNSNLRNKACTEKRCIQKDHLRCIGDCYVCPWHVAGIFESLDDPEVCYENALVVSESAEDVVMNNEMWAFVFAYADRIERNGALILRMSILEGKSNREIASILGMCSRKIDRVMKRILSGLRAQKDYFF